MSSFNANEPDLRTLHLNALELDPEQDYTIGDIRRQYKALALSRHPDKGGNREAFQAIGSAEAFFKENPYHLERHTPLNHGSIRFDDFFTGSEFKAEAEGSDSDSNSEYGSDSPSEMENNADQMRNYFTNSETPLAHLEALAHFDNDQEAFFNLFRAAEFERSVRQEIDQNISSIPREVEYEEKIRDAGPLNRVFHDWIPNVELIHELREDQDFQTALQQAQEKAEQAAAEKVEEKLRLARFHQADSIRKALKKQKASLGKRIQGLRTQYEVGAMPPEYDILMARKAYVNQLRTTLNAWIHDPQTVQGLPIAPTAARLDAGNVGTGWFTKILAGLLNLFVDSRTARLGNKATIFLNSKREIPTQNPDAPTEA